jgi:hypothetical protein
MEVGWICVRGYTGIYIKFLSFVTQRSCGGNKWYEYWRREDLLLEKAQGLWRRQHQLELEDFMLLQRREYCSQLKWKMWQLLCNLRQLFSQQLQPLQEERQQQRDIQQLQQCQQREQTRWRLKRQRRLQVLREQEPEIQQEQDQQPQQQQPQEPQAPQQEGQLQPRQQMLLLLQQWEGEFQQMSHRLLQQLHTAL